MVPVVKKFLRHRISTTSYFTAVGFLFCFVGSFLNSCGCSMAKSKTPPQETIFYPLTGTDLGSQPSLTARDRDLVSVLEVRIEPGDLDPRLLIPLSVTLPTLPRAENLTTYQKMLLINFEAGS